MADHMSNGIGPTSGDVEMKEEAAAEMSMANIQQAPPADMTDPNPPPTATVAASQLPVAATEHLSTIHPAPQNSAATPPAPAATSARPGSLPPPPSARPEKPVAHGGPTRQYLNQNITPHLLEGMKYVAAYEPEKPLSWLANFLQERSKEVEG